MIYKENYWKENKRLEKKCKIFLCEVLKGTEENSEWIQ